MVRQNKTAHFNIPMCIACVLLCLTLLSIHMTSGLFARYTTSDSAMDSARVAAFHVTESRRSFSEELVLPLSPGTFETQILVTNQSEVAIQYEIHVENVTRNVPLQFQIGTDSPSFTDSAALYSLAPDSQDTYTITIIWEQENAWYYAGMVDLIEITLSAQQTD
ncbi:MAG: hypothetical protein IJ036_03325 [Lachnospiraceae bacterium]|nr:hypothetical protein [Lachnospiraceae bacterium]